MGPNSSTHFFTFKSSKRSKKSQKKRKKNVMKAKKKNHTKNELPP